MLRATARPASVRAFNSQCNFDEPMQKDKELVPNGPQEPAPFGHEMRPEPSDSRPIARLPPPSQTLPPREPDVKVPSKLPANSGLKVMLFGRPQLLLLLLLLFIHRGLLIVPEPCGYAVLLLIANIQKTVP